MAVSSRELKKRELKKRMMDTRTEESRDGYDTDGEKKQISLEEKWKRKKKRRRIIIVCAFSAVVLAAAAVFVVYHYVPYRSYSLSWEKELNAGDMTETETFGNSIIRYSADGAACYDRSGKELWVDSFEMKSPRVYKNGLFLCIADCGGNDINIYSESAGLTGTARTLLPITKAVVAQNGIAAALTEDADAAYITFFQKDGKDIDISIKSRLAGEGYPVDIALAPDGSRLIAAYVYIEGSQLQSRTVFYDFSEVGKSVPNRLVGGFEEPFGSSLIAGVRFTDSVYSYAAADNGLYFFSSRNLSSPELIREEKYTDVIETVFDSPGHVGVVLKNTEGEKAYRLILYEPDGGETLRYDFDFKYRHIDCDDRNICFSGDNSCMILNLKGVVKYEGAMDTSSSAIMTGKLPGTFVFADNTGIREYVFR